MSKKGLLILILLLAFSAVAINTAEAKNYPRLVDTQDNDAHPWGGDDNNNDIGEYDPFNPIAPVKDPTVTIYGPKGMFTGGLWSAIWDKLEFVALRVYSGFRSTEDDNRVRTPGSTAYDSGDSGDFSVGGRTGE